MVFHIIHASFWLDFWSIWPDRTDIEDAMRRGFGASWDKPAPPPRKFAKYPLENKLYHGAIIAGRALGHRHRRVHDVSGADDFLPPQSVSVQRYDVGMMYVLHGLAGVGLIALVMVHVYFGLRPEKLRDHEVDDLRLDEP